MTIALNHTIVPATDKRASADFLGGILGLPAGPAWGPFVGLAVPNGVTLDFVDAGQVVDHHHYAFLVSDEEFDPIMARIRASGAAFYADPHRSRPGAINDHFGGRGVYFDDPDGHLMEVLTRPYAPAP